MLKKVSGIIALSVICLFLAAGIGSALTTKTFSITVLTKEKTVLVSDKEILGVLDFNYKVTKDATITSTSEGVFLSYKGNLIEGTIKLKAPNAVLDALLKDKRSVDIKYLLSKNKKITEYQFSRATIEGKEVKKKNNKVTEAAYRFRAQSIIESAR